MLCARRSLRLATLFFALVAATAIDIRCRRPDINTPIHPEMDRRKFSIYSSPAGGNTGMGNFLVFWPVAWATAALTGYDIAIIEDSLIGKMCLVINCGFSMMSDIIKEYDYADKNPKVYKFGNIIGYLNGGPIFNDDVIYISGYLGHQSAGMYNAQTTPCLAAITGCAQNDTLCMEHYAFNSLIKGPFAPAAAQSLHNRVSGMGHHLVQHFLHRPLAALPRLDGAFQLRLQYPEMEAGKGRDEVASFFSSDLGLLVAEKSLQELTAFFTHPKHRFLSRPHRHNQLLIYISCDDAVDKVHFAELLGKSEIYIPEVGNMTVVPVFVHNIVNMSHTKSFDHLKKNEFLSSPAYFNFVDTIFDWYMLANSNIVWSYRNAHLVSTFAESASRVVDRDSCDYSTFGKIRVMNGRHTGYANIWEPRHPVPGNVTCTLPPPSAHELLFDAMSPQP